MRKANLIKTVLNNNQTPIRINERLHRSFVLNIQIKFERFVSQELHITWFVKTNVTFENTKHFKNTASTNKYNMLKQIQNY